MNEKVGWMKADGIERIRPKHDNVTRYNCFK